MQARLIQRIPSLIAHSVCGTIWGFCVIFGFVKESFQVNQINLICYSAIGECPIYNENCQVCGNYSIVYRILSLLGGTIGLAQILFISNNLLFSLFCLKHLSFVYLYRQNLKRIMFILSYLPSVYVFQYLNYYVILCSNSNALCKQQPRYYKHIIANLYYTLVIICIVHLTTDLISLGLFFYLFFKFTYKIWKDVNIFENTLNVFQVFDENDDEICLFKKMDYNRNSDETINDFFQKWIHMRSDDINKTIKIKVKETMKFISQGLDRCYDKFDVNSFKRSLIKQNIVNSEFLWNTLVNTDTEYINKESLEVAYYNLFYKKKSIANVLYTDIFVIENFRYIILFVLYPAAFIAVSRVFGYRNAFGEGVDLFKTYILSISVVMVKLSEIVSFLMLMIFERPFDIGDVILFNDSMYNIDNLSLSHIYLKGSYYVVASHKTILNGHIKNLTKKSLSDSIELTFPVNISDEKLNKQVMFFCIKEYSDNNPQDILLSSLHLGWIHIGYDSKTFKINWHYKFHVFDQSRVKHVKRRFSDFIVTKFSDLVTENVMIFKLAGGGITSNTNFNQERHLK